MLKIIAVAIAFLFLLFLTFITIFTIVAVFAINAKEHKANKHAVSYRGTILSNEEVKKYNLLFPKRGQIIPTKPAYKYYPQYTVQFWINGKEYIESVVFKEEKQVGETVEVKCIWNEDATLHPIDIGKVEGFRNLRIAFLFSGALVILMIGLKFIK